MRVSIYNVFIGKDGQYYFNLTAKNYEIILQSEGYKTEQGALKGVESVQKNCQDETRYERKLAKNSEYYFVLKAVNGELIGRSETYSSKQAMEKGIASVKQNGITTVIEKINKKGLNIFVNKNKYKVAESELTGEEILELAGLSSREYSLFLIKGTNSDKIEPFQIVELKNGMHFHAILSDIKFG